MAEDVLLNKAAVIERTLRRIAEEYDGAEDQIETDIRRQDAVVLNLQRACQAAIDGGMYLVDMGMKKGDDKRLKTGWEMVKRNVDRIRSQVLNILYYAKERRPNWNMFSAPDMAKEILTIMEAKATELDVELKGEIDAGAGDFEADPQAIRSMLLNLMENSLDACRVDNNKTEHLVTFGLKSDDDHIRFEIEDNGIGMDQETREKAFSLFFSSKGAKGTGLGLFIANKITEAHGGRIELESEIDKGSHFAVIIPRKKKTNRIKGF